MAHCHDLRQKLNEIFKIMITSERVQKDKGWLPQQAMQTSLWEILFWLPLALR